MKPARLESGSADSLVRDEDELWRLAQHLAEHWVLNRMPKGRCSLLGRWGQGIKSSSQDVWVQIPYQLLAALGSSLPQAWFSGGVAPVVQMRQAVEIQPVSISAGHGPSYTKAAVTAVRTEGWGQGIPCAHALAAYNLGLDWSHQKGTESQGHTLALSSSHTGVSSAAPPSLLTCFHWRRTLQSMRQPAAQTL